MKTSALQDDVALMQPTAVEGPRQTEWISCAMRSRQPAVAAHEETDSPAQVPPSAVAASEGELDGGELLEQDPASRTNARPNASLVLIACLPNNQVMPQG